MTHFPEDAIFTASETLESLWEEFERTGSVQAFLKYQQLAQSVPAEETVPTQV